MKVAPLFVLWILFSVNAYAVSYSVIDEYHDINYHYVILQQTPDKTGTLNSDFYLYADQFKDYKIEKQQRINEEIPQFVKVAHEYPCSEKDAGNGSLSSAKCFTYTYEETDPLIVQKEIWQPVSGLKDSARISFSNSYADLTPSILRISWHNRLDFAFGSAGYWEINPTNFWNDSWSYRKKLEITNPHDSNLNNYPCNFTLDAATLIDNSKLNATGQDLRILDSSEVSLPWINFSSLYSATAQIRFKCNITASSDATFYVYYGNLNVASHTYTNQTDIAGFRDDNNVRFLLHLDEGTGTPVDAAQATGASFNNATWNVTAKFDGTALFFRGSQQFIMFNDAAAYDITTSITMEAWVYPLSDAIDDTGYFVIGKRTGGGSDRNNYGMIYDQDSSSIGINYQGDTTWVTETNALTTTVNNWTYIAVVYDEAAQECRYYYNGRLIGKDACTTEPTVNAAKVTLGAIDDLSTGNADNNYQHFILDEVRVSNVTRTSAEINHSAMAFRPNSTLGAEETPQYDPEVFNCTIVPQTPTGASNLNCTAIGLDTENSQFTYSFYWMVNEIFQAAYNSSLLGNNNTYTYTGVLIPNGAVNESDNWTCWCRVNDSSGYSVWINDTVFIDPAPAGVENTSFTCDYNKFPNIKILNRIDWLCSFNISASTTNTYKCYSMATYAGQIIQVNPAERTIDQVGVVDYFESSPSGSMYQYVFPYFTTEDLRHGQEVNFTVVCAGNNETLRFEAQVTPMIKAPTQAQDADTWVKQNAAGIGFSFVFLIIFVSVIYIVWSGVKIW